ncbi:MAG TPA: AMP-binding protein [Roseimicrobium sp.]|nr:AMP-binding protein [Roseimicrobium sp.]
MKALTQLKNGWRSLPEESIRHLQAEQFRTYLRDTVLPFSPHYRHAFAKWGLRAEDFQTLDDLQLLPFTDKSALVPLPDAPLRYRDYILAPSTEELSHRPSTVVNALLHGRDAARHELEHEFRPIFMTSTTGRSADPVPFVYTGHDLDLLSVTGRRLFEVCGASPEQRLLNMFPYAPHLAFWQTHYGATAFGVFMLATGGGKVMGTEGNLRMLRKIQPDVLIGMPTFVYHLLHEAADQGVRCQGLKRIVLGGEKVPDGMRRKLSELASELGATRVEIVSTYGFTEAKCAWAECPCTAEETPTGFHLYPDTGIVEIIDPESGATLPPGHPGEIVYTPLDSRGSVVLRYRTGDYIDGGLTYTPCPRCGRCLPRLTGRISRRSEIRAMHLDKVKGTLVDFNELEHVLDDAPGVGAWQIELRKRHDDPLDLDEVVLHINSINGVEHTDLVRDLDRRFAERTEFHPNRVEFHSIDALREMQGVGVQLKELKVVDHRPTSKEPSDGHRAAVPAGIPQEVVS